VRALCAPLIACLLALPAHAAPTFSQPCPVTIEGYSDHTMEPFLSRDGETLFFNNRNDPPRETDLHSARRIDDHTFRYRGRVAGANSADLDGVPTLSRAGRFCFVSPRSYRETLGSIWCGLWDGQGLAQPALQPQASPRVPGRLMFDVEIDAAGTVLLLSDGRFGAGGFPRTADLRQARWRDGAFHLEPRDDALFAALNTRALEYAAAVSADGLEIAFTRLEGGPLLARASLWTARRAQVGAAFAAPARITAVTGFVEAPTYAPDGALYYHRRESGRFALWRIARAS
jgi:hypothetical protein